MTTSTGRWGERSACSTARLTVCVMSTACKVFITLLGGRWDRRATPEAYHADSLPDRRCRWDELWARMLVRTRQRAARPRGSHAIEPQRSMRYASLDMRVKATDLPEVLLIEPQIFG